MLKRLGLALRNFFFPPLGAPRSAMLMVYLTLGVLALGTLVGGAYAWDYTNSPEFCGKQCHTMPPEFTSYLLSPHARIRCVECHIGREFVGNQFLRKAGDMRHVFAQAFTNYELPIRVHEMRPAPEICERCHSPEKFSDDSLRVIRSYKPDAANTPLDTYLILKTGGGSKRQGLGRGIHWHIENKIQFLATDKHNQVIPYIRANNDDGTFDEYVDIESGFDPKTVDETKLETMDCIACHNRITHLINQPEVAVDIALQRGTISADIPEIRLKGVEVLEAAYASKPHALNGIAGLENYYRVVHPEYYAAERAKVRAAIQSLQEIYDQSVYPEQKQDWNSHENNLGHKDFPGCLRCHDGKHLNAEQEAIRLECNLCHAIPVVAGKEQFVTSIEISRGLEPETHKNANWITGHRDYFDRTCANCHTVGDPGGVSDTTFCSNSACHGVAWEFAGFDAPGLAEIIAAQLPPPAPDVPVGELLPTYASLQPVFEVDCGECHGEDKSGGLQLTTYADTMLGGASGRAVVPGDPDASILIQVQTADHFAILDRDVLDVIRQWIADGAPEN